MIVCLFDIDGTLLSSGGAGRAALEEAFADEFGTRGVIENVKLSGRTDFAIVGDILRQTGLESDANRQRLLSAYLRHLPECLSRLKGRVLPGVEALLEQLRLHEGIAVGLLTGNVCEGAKIKLGHFGLGEHFRFGGYGDRHADRDDVARVAFAESERHLGRRLDPTRVWVIGDTPLDVRCARAIGANVAAVLTGWHTREELTVCQPDLLLDDLSDPGELLARWV